MEKTKQISLNVEADKGIGPFQIGMTVNEIISELKSLGEKMGKIDIVSSDEAVDTLFIVIPQEGLSLKFDPVSQRLTTITLKKDNEGIRFFNYTFSEQPIIVATGDFDCKFSYFSNIIGPAKIFELDEGRRNFKVKQEGFEAYFSSYSDGNSSNSNFYKIIIFPEKELEKERCSNFFEVSMFGDRIVIKFESDDETTIKLSESAESIIYKLKNPNFIQNITRTLDEKAASHYILNYFQLGLDFVISNRTHKCVKIIAHSNNPYDPSFGLHDRCNFRLMLDKSFFSKFAEQASFRKMSAESVPSEANDSQEMSKADDSQLNSEMSIIIDKTNLNINPTSNFREVVNMMDKLEKKTRCEGKLGVTFGYYTLENFKVEVIDSNHQISSVSI